MSPPSPSAASSRFGSGRSVLPSGRSGADQVGAVALSTASSTSAIRPWPPPSCGDSSSSSVLVRGGSAASRTLRTSSSDSSCFQARTTSHAPAARRYSRPSRVRQSPKMQNAPASRTGASPVSAAPSAASAAPRASGNCARCSALALSTGYRNRAMLGRGSAAMTAGWHSLSSDRFRRALITSCLRGRSANSFTMAATVPGPCSPPANVLRPASSAQTLPITLPRKISGSSYPARAGGLGLEMKAASRNRSIVSSAQSAS
mmetsp:Transcript_12746/g.34481  ORF Transcript_12746/g.34481 Transcript_12746/m.34481 type:complete len:260 (-) Transcript_12746:588-1367(-)